MIALKPTKRIFVLLLGISILKGKLFVFPNVRKCSLLYLQPQYEQIYTNWYL